MKGNGFFPKVSKGDRVKAGQLILEFAMEEIKKAGHPTATALIVTNSDEYENIDLGIGRKYMTKEAIGSVTKN